MKKYTILILLILLLSASLAFTYHIENTFPLFGRLIILDPGHGSKDPGSVYGDIYEKDYNLTFARNLKTELERRGASVILTRDGDYDLSDPDASSRKRSDFDNRIKLIEDNKPDLYLSLHMNSIAKTEYYGSQSFYSTVNPKNEILAKILQKNFNEFFEYDKEPKKIGNDKYMFNKISTTGVLIEYGFISSSKDRENLLDEEYRIDLSKVITNSIIEYFT